MRDLPSELIHVGVNAGSRQKESHYNCLKDARYQLVDTLIKRRIVEGRLNPTVRTAIRYYLSDKIDQKIDKTLKLNSKKRCALLPG
jgi:hypothetical protein